MSTPTTTKGAGDILVSVQIPFGVGVRPCLRRRRHLFTIYINLHTGKSGHARRPYQILKLISI